MNYKINISIVSLLFYLMIHSVSCLKCHVCNTHNPGQQDCEKIESANIKYLLDCAGPHNVSCRIQEQWVDFEVLGQKHDKRTIRQCASTPFEESRPCYYRTGFGGKINICNCLGDGCNEASRTASTLIMTIGTLLLFTILL